jgi:hypothetical protein
LTGKFIPADKWLAHREPDEGTNTRIIEQADQHARELRELMQPGHGR